MPRPGECSDVQQEHHVASMQCRAQLHIGAAHQSALSPRHAVGAGGGPNQAARVLAGPALAAHRTAVISRTVCQRGAGLRARPQHSTAHVEPREIGIRAESLQQGLARAQACARHQA